jgi:hypothetical protein
LSPYLKALVFSALGSFVVQPVFEWLAFYEPHGWKDYYSLPILFAIYLGGHYLTGRGQYEKL